MLMKKIYSFLMVLALMCISTVARAEEHTATITSDPENNWFSGYVSFPVSEIVAELGLADEAALNELLNNEENSAVYVKTADGEKSNAYTGNHNEFWLNTNGLPVVLGDEAVWYAGLYYDEAGTDGDESWESEFYVQVGQKPDVFKNIYTDSDLSCVLYLVNGDKVATFNVNLHVNAAPVPEDLGDILLSQLEIVKDYALTIPFTEGREYGDIPVSATLEGIYDALGIPAEELDAKAEGRTFAQPVLSIYNSETDESTYELSDTLVNPIDATDGWFGRYANYDEDSGNDIPFEINALRGWGTGCTFYTHAITLEDSEFSVVAGQFPGTLKVGDTDYAYLYIVNGTKAARIKVEVEVEPAPVIDPETMEQVGDTTIVQTATKISDYLNIITPLNNIAAIAEALEVEDPADITFYHLPTSGEGFNSDLSDGWGAWLNADGNYCTWGSDARVMVAYDIEDGVYSIQSLQMAGTVTDGDVYSFPVFLVNETAGKYYTINFTYNVKLPEITIPQSEWIEKGKLEYDVQVIPSEAYLLAQNTEVDLAFIKRVLEIEDTDILTLYGDIENPTSETLYTKQLTLTPEGGFWLKSVNGKLYPASFGDADAMGMDWQNSGTGIISWYNKPSTRSAGDQYTGNFYLVDEVNGTFVKIVCNIEFVDEIGDAPEAIGEADVVITVAESTMNGDGLYEGNIEWSEVLSALEITEDDIEGYIWMVQNQSGKLVNFGTASSFFGEEAIMDKNGYNTENSDDAVFAIGYDFATQKLVFSLFGEEPEEGVLYQTKIALKSDAGYYVFNVTAASEATITGINGVAAPKAKAGNVYDINGRKVSAPANGIYIIDGVKVYVK